MAKQNKLVPIDPTPAHALEKRLKVLFFHQLPRGTCATFEFEGETWIALPQVKYRRITSVLDRLLGIHARIREETFGMINDHPEDTMRILRILEKCKWAKKVENELISEKISSQTMMRLPYAKEDQDLRHPIRVSCAQVPCCSDCQDRITAQVWGSMWCDWSNP